MQFKHARFYKFFAWLFFIAVFLNLFFSPFQELFLVNLVFLLRHGDARHATLLFLSRNRGILREGVSQALVGDGPYRAALDAAARALAPSDPSRRLR